MPDVMLNGVEGKIEAKVELTKDQTSPFCMLFHPHPLHGGTMHNKVIYNLNKAFIKAEFSTVRFNFRGVGRSAGKFDNGLGELADSAAILDWIHTEFTLAKSVWIAGYSFGAWIAMQLLMRRPEIKSYIVIAPPANIYDFTFLAPCPAPGLIMYGSDDKTVPANYSKALVKHIDMQQVVDVESYEIKKADHFFLNDLDKIQSEAHNYIINHENNKTVI